MSRQTFKQLAYKSVDDFIFGKSVKPVIMKNGMVIGGGMVYPELNMTLPMMTIREDTMPKVLKQYKQMATGACEKAVELAAPGVVLEIELLPPCTAHPAWGIAVNQVVADVLREFEAKHGLKGLLRITPVDIREGDDLEHMFHGSHWARLMECFRGSADVARDMSFLSIESVGGKNLHDDALMMCDLPKILFSLGTVACKDMGVLWDEIVKIAGETNTVAAGDTACGFANTAMVLANRQLIPRTFAAVDRVMTAVRTMVAVECGAEGPDKDCGYEGVYLKAITGTPISMEGRTSACAHSSTVGNIVGAACDLWSNESVENVRLLGGMAPTVYMEQLVYDCRMMNTATELGQAQNLREIFVQSDRKLDPHAYIMDPQVVFDIAAQIIKGKDHFERTKIAAQATIESLRKAYQANELDLADRDAKYLDIMEMQLESMPNDQEAFNADMIKNNTTEKFDPAKYDLTTGCPKTLSSAS